MRTKSSIEDLSARTVDSYEGKQLKFALHLVKSLAWYKDAWASGRQVPVDLWTEGKLFSNKIAQFDKI